MEDNFNSGNQITDLTEKLMDVEKKQYNMLRIMMAANVGLAVGLILAMLLIVPKLLSVANDAQQAVTDVHALAGSAENTLKGIDGMVENANKTISTAGKVVEENTEEMEEALDHINGIDFESLNQAIKDLADAVEPLGNLSRMFP